MSEEDASVGLSQLMAPDGQLPDASMLKDPDTIYPGQVLRIP